MPPRLVYLVRHGEKLGDPDNDGDGGPHLAIQGSARASALPSLFLPSSSVLSAQINLAGNTLAEGYVPEPVAGIAPRFETPDFIFATADSANSSRPRETISPTALALGRPFDSTSYSHKPEGVAGLSAALLGGAYAGKVILVCWHHGSIPAVAGGLGVAAPPAWPGSTVFDRVWAIDFTQAPLAIVDQPQRLLFGDSQA
jgi:hypothetical protein